MPFISGLWIEPEDKTKEKQKVTPSQVNLSFTLGSPVGDTYRMGYMVSVRNNVLSPELSLLNSNVDMKSLEDSIIAKIDRYDRKYMKLEKFSISSATFELDQKKWMRDALSSVRPNNRVSKFEQRFKLKKQIPKMIQFSATRINFDKYIVRRFVEYMEKHNTTRTWFTKFLPRDIAGKIRLKISTMFDYEYDWQSNTIIGKLKNIYIMGILFAVGYEVNRRNKRKHIKMNFEKSVKKKSKKFDRKKWQSFIKKRFI
jgi:hypothetical protein